MAIQIGVQGPVFQPFTVVKSEIFVGVSRAQFHMAVSAERALGRTIVVSTSMGCPGDCGQQGTGEKGCGDKGFKGHRTVPIDAGL